jgi:glycosyltransferase involved in cell wall biosynthesis
MPKVSVCIPVFNPGDYLQGAIESVLRQSFSDFELVIVDDASSQPIEVMVSSFRDRRLQFERNLRNLGLVENWNRCLELATGDYVTIFHQDDLMHPQNLCKKVAALDANPHVGFAYSNIRRIDVEGRVMGGHWIPQPENDAVFSAEQVFMMIATSGNPISCPSVVVRQQCYRELGKFDKRLPYAVDLEMWMRIAVHFGVLYLADPLIDQRVHGGQETARFQGTGRDYEDVLRAFDIVRSQNSDTLPSNLLVYMAGAYRTLSNQALQMARWKLRRGKILQSLQYGLIVLKALQRSIFTLQ